MSTTYRFVNSTRKKQTLELQAFLTQERDTMVECIKQWGKGVMEDNVLELAQEAAQELGSFPS